jgi:hypothetical protein
MALDSGLLTEPEDGVEVAPDAAGVGAPVDRPVKHDEERAGWTTTESREAFHCWYTWVKMTASSRDTSCCSATSVHRGSPRPVIYN